MSQVRRNKYFITFSHNYQFYSFINQRLILYLQTHQTEQRPLLHKFTLAKLDKLFYLTKFCIKNHRNKLAAVQSFMNCRTIMILSHYNALQKYQV